MLQYYINEPDSAHKTEGSNFGPGLSVSDALESAELRATKGRDRVFPVVVGFSLVAHAAVATAILIGAAVSTVGDGATELNAISVTIISAADASAASSASNPGVPVEVTPDVPNSIASNDAAAAKPEAVDLPPPELVLPSPAVSTAILQTPPDIQPKTDTTDLPQPQERKEDRREQAADASQAAAANAPVSVGDTTAGQVSASQGDMERYAREVALVVGRNRPKGIGARGKVTVEFTLSIADGRVETVKVSKTSGSAKLDALAIAVIGKSSYPRPPAGMTSAQLTYRVPFTFE